MQCNQKTSDLIKDRKVLNLCSQESDSQWLIENKANKVHVLEPTKIKEKIRDGEIDTIFFRASEQSIDGFKILGKLLQEADLKNKGCKLIIANEIAEDSLVNYIHERMDELLRFLGFSKEIYSVEKVAYSVYN